MRLLILRLSSLGDVVLLWPVLENLRQTYPQAHLACLVKPAYADALKAHPAVNEVILYESFGKTLAFLRQQRWDIILDLHGVLKTRLLTLLTPADKKTIYNKDIFWRRSLVWFGKNKEGNRRFHHVLDRYFNAIKDLGVARKANGRIRLKEAVANNFIIGFVPGAKWATKRWLPERFAQLGRQLLEKYPQCRIFLLGDARDRDLCEGIKIDFNDNQRIVNLAGQLTLAQLIAVIKDCCLMVTNDSGPMHIAWQLGVPTVAIFGPTVKEFGFYPQGDHARVVEESDLNCRPCSLHGSHRCPRGHFLCMKLVTTDRIFAACQETLVKNSR